MSAPTFATKARVVWRSLWVQASWSFKGMQTVGFAYALAPLLDGKDEMKREKLLAHLELFNTHPFLATAAVAATAKEENAAEGVSADAAQTRRFMMGAMGGMGDSLFWGGLKIFAAVLGVALAVEGWLYAPFLAVGLCLAVGLAARWRSLELGLAHGKMALLELQKCKPVLVAARLKLAAAALLGWTAVRHATAGAATLGFGEYEALGFAAAVTLATAYATRRGTDPLIIIYAAFAAALIIGVT